MKNSFQFLSALLFVFTLVSCGPSEHQAVLDSMDSLNRKLDSVALEMQSIDSAKMAGYLKEVESNIKFIKSNYKDTMNLELSIFLSDYRSLRKPFKEFLAKKKEFMEEILFSKNQLKDLSSDINDDKLTKDTIAVYYASERDADQVLIEEHSLRIKGLKGKMEFFEKSNPRVLAIIDSLKMAQK